MPRVCVSIQCRRGTKKNDSFYLKYVNIRLTMLFINLNRSAWTIAIMSPTRLVIIRVIHVNREIITTSGLKRNITAFFVSSLPLLPVLQLFHMSPFHLLRSRAKTALLTINLKLYLTMAVDQRNSVPAIWFRLRSVHVVRLVSIVAASRPLSVDLYSIRTIAVKLPVAVYAVMYSELYS